MVRLRKKADSVKLQGTMAVCCVQRWVPVCVIDSNIPTCTVRGSGSACQLVLWQQKRR